MQTAGIKQDRKARRPWPRLAVAAVRLVLKTGKAAGAQARGAGRFGQGPGRNPSART
ncbi:hypothetical protein METH_09270 [Leisingera methylohalidivorans DSM 14336]|uniref:Uncharacterized protein n=1 Tax=Leisingera methylohalidivorans DSM 14336 TaxID=999552 RepID=V9W066_9RHOB|nr:hypothetical protein METH_09270 [Leisingera methylohalidivorans DSM 14336]